MSVVALLAAGAAQAQDVSIHESLDSRSSATTIYGGTFTGAGWRVDDSASRMYWDLGTQVNRGRVRVVIDDVDWSNLLYDNNHFIELFDEGGHWSAHRAINLRVYGSDDPESWGQVKLKCWDDLGNVAEARGPRVDWDGGPHTWEIEWDETVARLTRDAEVLVELDVTGMDLSVGTLWLPLNDWIYDYSAPIGALYSDLALDAWEPGSTEPEEPYEDPDGSLLPIEDAGVDASLGGAVYPDEEDLPIESSYEVSYLLYDLSALQGTVTSARLTLHARADAHAQGDGGTVYAVADTSWQEESLCWDDRPALGAPLASFGAVGPLDAVTLDVTPGVTAGGLVAFAIASDGTDGAHFSSKEDGLGSGAAELDVVVVPADGGDDGGASDTGPASGETDPWSGARRGRAQPDAGESGCGCATATRGPAAWAVAVLVGAISRRRRP